MPSDTSTDDDTRVDTADAPGGFSSLPLDVISTHVLRSDFLPEPGDLGRLRAVSRGMRDAVDATGRVIKKLSNEEAGRLGYLSLLKDRHSRGRLKSWEDKKWLCVAAARNGGLEELKALRADKWPWDWKTCAHAAKGGHLEVLKWMWMRENNGPWGVSGLGLPWHEHTCKYAAWGGQLEVLKLLRENNCPWGVHTCASAAEGGHLEVLKWARENGCPWHESTCYYAARYYHLDVLKWLRENGCP